LLTASVRNDKEVLMTEKSLTLPGTELKCFFNSAHSLGTVKLAVKKLTIAKYVMNLTMRIRAKQQQGLDFCNIY
jgi:hypothetical protein